MIFNFFLRLFASAVIFLGRWKITGGLYPNVDKAVMIFAPHTSHWDGVYGLAVLISRKVPFRFFVKRELMCFPLGWLLKKLGAIPVDRKNLLRAGGVLNEAVDILEKKSKIFIVIQPEGTRKNHKEWKTGFYQIAKRANVPVMTNYLDYSKKEGGFGKLFYLTENEKEDINRLKKFYIDMKGKNS